MTTPTPNTSTHNVPEVLEQTSAPAYVPYPLEGIQDERSTLNPTVGLPRPNKAEFLDNTEERCAVVLVLDKSASMIGEPARLLNEALAKFKSNLMEDVTVARKIDVAMNEFNNLARYHPFQNAEIWQPPTVEPGGGTCLSYALNVAMDAVTQRKDDYRMNGISYYRPWVLLLTDGYPEHDSEDELTAVGQRVREAHNARQCNLFAIICDDNDENEAAFSVIRDKITPPGRPPKKVTSANFSELFIWLSNSMTSVSRSSPTDQIVLEDTSGWEIV